MTDFLPFLPPLLLLPPLPSLHHELESSGLLRDARAGAEIIDRGDSMVSRRQECKNARVQRAECLGRIPLFPTLAISFPEGALLSIGELGRN